MKRILGAFGAACLLALCVTGIVLVVRAQRQQAVMRQFIAAGPANLAREEAAARQEGIPLATAQLQQPLPPPDQNAAPLYVTLTNLLHDKPLGLPKYVEGMDAFHTYTPEQIATVRKILASRQDVLALVHQAAEKPKCVFVRDWDKGPDMRFPEYKPMCEAAWLIKTESYLLARGGSYKESIVNQERGFRIAEHAASDPWLISYLVGNAIETNTLFGMQSIMALSGPVRVVADLRETVAARHSHLSLRRAMAGETGYYNASFVRMHRGEKNGVSAAFAAGGFPDTTTPVIHLSASEKKNLHELIDAWEADYLTRMRPLVVATDQPQSARRAAHASLSERVTHGGNDPTGIAHMFTDILLPNGQKLAENDLRLKTRETVTLAAAAILAGKSKSGAYPAALPPGFFDPFTDKPLGYRREGTSGFVVYSAGPTGHFDGGKPGQKVPGQESVFRYPAVPVPPN